MTKTRHEHDMNTTWTWHEHDMCRNGREMCRRVNNGTVWQCMAHQIWSNTVKWIVFVVKIFSCGTESQGTIRKSSLFGSPEEFYRCVFRRAKGVLILACQGRRYFEAERLVRTAIIIYFDCRFETALTTKQFRTWALVSGNLRSFCISCLKFDPVFRRNAGIALSNRSQETWPVGNLFFMLAGWLIIEPFFLHFAAACPNAQSW